MGAPIVHFEIIGKDAVTTIALCTDPAGNVFGLTKGQ
jgi:predicted enzyme related to lactoylglutathione lyase